jgi:hypothetical protein
MLLKFFTGGLFFQREGLAFHWKDWLFTGRTDSEENRFFKGEPNLSEVMLI